MPIYRYVEFVLYSILSLLPYFLIALYPIRNKLRLSRCCIVFSLIVLYMINFIHTYLIAKGFQASLLSPVTTAIYVCFYLAVVKQHKGKSLFFLLCLSNINSFNEMIAKFIEGRLFSSLAYQIDRWSLSLCLVVAELIALIPVFSYVKRVYTPTMEQDKNITDWRFFWIVPATFYLIWYVYIFMGNLPTMEILLSPKLTLFQLFIFAGSFFVYHSMIRLVNEQNKNEALQEKERLHQTQLSQYKILRDNVVETKKLRHDLRHHLKVMAAYAKGKKTKELLAYIDQCDKVISDHTNTFFL